MTENSPRPAPQAAAGSARLLHAENILAGHPDRMCDAVAEGIVEAAVRHDREALVGVEVALHRHQLFITGRIAAGDGHALGDDELHHLVEDQIRKAGYTGDWTHPVHVTSDLERGPLEDDERAIRRYSDDQGLAVGHADPSTPTLLPVEVHVARLARETLRRVREEHQDMLGPDGKILVRLRQRPGARARLEHANVSIQHARGVGYDKLHDLLLEPLQQTLSEAGAVCDVPAEYDGQTVRLNGIGDFTCGGPLGDNGLSGKKLVVDHYGPHVPIGGGAICGKDVHKPDRAAALRSRQIAVRLSRALGQAATVQTGFLPGLEAPDRLQAQLQDGTLLDEGDIGAAIRLPDLTLSGTAAELELYDVCWPEQMRKGYFGTGAAWER
jgi:S-adenosylmethionine synthetase